MIPLSPTGRVNWEKPVPPQIFWLLWFALTTSIPIYQFTLGRGLPQGPNAPAEGINPILVLAVGEILAATAVRWIVMPRITARARLLVAMVVGLALSESVEFFGIFLIPSSQPETKLSLFVLSLLGCAQFAPFYARPSPAS